MPLHAVDQLILSQVPYLDVIINASRHDLVAGVIESDAEYLVGVLKRVDRCLLSDVPQLDGTVVAASADQLRATACREAGVHEGGMAFQTLHTLARLCVPDTHGLVRAGREK